MNAPEVATQTGYSERKVYYVISYLKKCCLLDKKLTRKGRGRRSLYRLRWKKTKESQESTVSKKICTHIVKKKNKNTFTGDLFKERRQAERNERMRRFKVMHFRAFLKSYTFLEASEVRMCTQVLAKHIKDKERKYLTHLWDYLNSIRYELATPKWCWTEPKKTYAWFGWVLKNAERKIVSACPKVI